MTEIQYHVTSVFVSLNESLFKVQTMGIVCDTMTL